MRKLKIIFLFGMIFSLLVNVSYSQEYKTVSLTVSGQGQTQDEAKQSALRNAIEQAFGTFISSNTKILNDNVIKDEIVSVSNGNIQDFNVISEVQIPDGGYTVTLKATVSVTNLTSFFENKGVSSEFKGSLFAFNINQQILNEKNESKAIKDMDQVIRNIADKSFDFTIKVSDPTSVDATNSNWRIPVSVSVYKNDNFNIIPEILYSTLKGISLSRDEALNYINLGKKVYPISFAFNSNDYSYILLRQEASVRKILSIIYYFNHSLQNFQIDNGIDRFKISSDKIKELSIEENFGIFVTKHRVCRATVAYLGGSVFFNYGSGGGWRGADSQLILNWTDWAKQSRQFGGCGYGWTENYNVYDFRVYTTFYPNDDLFNNRFTFVNKLSEQFINREAGLIISFADRDIFYKLYDNMIAKNKKQKKKKKKKKKISNENVVIIKKELIKFEFKDIRSIDEINNISEYKVLPIKN